MLKFKRKSGADPRYCQHRGETREPFVVGVQGPLKESFLGLKNSGPSPPDPHRKIDKKCILPEEELE